jgi:hypothetical protein
MQRFCEKMPQSLARHLLFQTVLLLILSGRGTCQDSTYLVEPGVHPANVIPVSKQFRYPEFREGRVLLSTGKQSEPLLLNYSLLYDAVVLIGANSDTVWLDKTLVEYVQIETDYYFSDVNQGYFRLVTKEGLLKLMIMSRWILIAKSSLNSQWIAFETPQTPSRVEDFYFTSQYTKFAKIEAYFFQGPTRKVYKSSKQSLIKIFPDNRKAINRYLSDRKIDFTKESDLKEVVTFCNSLTSATNPAK